MAIQHIERQLAGRGVKVELSLHVVTNNLAKDELHAAGQELAKRISFQLSELESGRPLVAVTPGIQPRVPVEGVPLPH